MPMNGQEMQLYNCAKRRPSTCDQCQYRLTFGCKSLYYIGGHTPDHTRTSVNKIELNQCFIY